MIDAPRSVLASAGIDNDTIDWLKKPDREVLAADLDWLDQPANQLISWGSEKYPPLLAEVPSPPAALFVIGDCDALWQPQIAVIGSRNPTRGGEDNASSFAAELSRRGFTITSGMASGIDALAHQAALSAGGRTVAVAGTGLDRVYPASSRDLAQRIPAQGAIVSEFPPGTPPRRSNFPSRNRIISGLSLAVLVIEAGLNSGTLITARMAANQGRDVFAIPGSIHNPMARGCHRLIRQGAKLVEDVTQIIGDIAPMAGKLAGELSAELLSNEQSMVEDDAEDPKLELDPDYRKLWSCLGFDPMPVDRIIEQSGLTARAVSAMLLMLELRGKVEAHPGGAWSRKK